MWVANRNDGTVSKLRASDGAVLGTFPVPPAPYGIAFDGTYMWVSGDLFMYVLRASDGTAVVHQHMQSGGVAFDGAYIWTAGPNFSLLYKF
jgi:DNA-binding beta-propeller fold protein YncE